jgi:hypothetical protein
MTLSVMKVRVSSRSGSMNYSPSPDQKSNEPSDQELRIAPYHCADNITFELCEIHNPIK